jgi:hypothetical protein
MCVVVQGEFSFLLFFEMGMTEKTNFLQGKGEHKK